MNNGCQSLPINYVEIFDFVIWDCADVLAMSDKN